MKRELLPTFESFSANMDKFVSEGKNNKHILDTVDNIHNLINLLKNSDDPEEKKMSSKLYTIVSPFIKQLHSMVTESMVYEDSFESDLLRISTGIRILKRENPKVYDVINKKFDLDKLYKQVEDIKKFADEWDRMTGGEKQDLARKLGVKFELSEDVNESVSSVDDILNSFLSDPSKYRIEIGSGTHGNDKPDKSWIISKIDEFINMYFFNEEKYYVLSDSDQSKYDKKLDDFKKDSVKNFKKFYDKWMELKEDKWHSTYQLKSGMYDEAQELIKV